MAIRPPEPVVEALVRIRDDPAWPAGRPAPRGQMHVTVAFLGPVADAGVLIRALGEAVGDACASAGPASARRVRLRGVGAFPSARRATVGWAGVDDGGLLAALNRAVTGRVGELAGHRPARPYHPHVTLVRFRRPVDLRAGLAALDAGVIGPAWSPAEAVLFESTTAAGGARHTPVARFPLGSGPIAR